MDHQPRPGRLAFICIHKDHEKEGKVPPREFAHSIDAPVPECHLHGPMQRQQNKPYFGQPIPEPVI